MRAGERRGRHRHAPRRALGVDLARAHGGGEVLRGRGAAEVDRPRPARDDVRRVPIYSLYSETREPTAAMLDGLDVLVIDLQDVGTRIYTYIYTMAYCLTAARRAGLPVVVCDRPNPIGGAVEGPQLDPAYRSFVGLYPIPMRHGLTIGELARLYAANEERYDCDLQVIAMRVAQQQASQRHASGFAVRPKCGALTLPGQQLCIGWR